MTISLFLRRLRPAGFRAALVVPIAGTAFGAVAGNAADDTGPALADPAFRGFFERFREAVTLDDREGVAAMTRLPIFLNGRKRDADGFRAEFDWLFTSVEKACFASETPVPENDVYSLFCGDLIFVFQKVAGVYRFTDIGVND
jgi:hypothetical protein